MNLATALRGALVMIFLGTALGLAHNALSPKPVPWKTVPKTTLSLDDLVPEDPGATAAEEEEEAAGDPSTGSLERDTAVEATTPTARPAEDAAPKETVGKTAGEQPISETKSASAEDAANPGVSETESVPAEDTANPGVSGTKSTSTEGASTPSASVPGGDYADIPEADYPFEVSLSRAKALYDRGGLIVLDAREQEEYEGGHIKGAQSAPFDLMVGDIEWLDRTAADPRPLLVYCDGTDCELSLNLGFELSQSGHRKVLVLTGGYAAWAEAGYPTATGDRP
jgi:rhodanese-related sulfurtransferase